YMVNKCGSGVTVATYSDTFIDTVRSICDNVVKFVRHTSRLGDITDRSLAVKFGSHNVVHHTTSIANFEGTGFETSNGGRADDSNALLLCDVQYFTSALQVSSQLLSTRRWAFNLTLSGTPSAMIAMD